MTRKKGWSSDIFRNVLQEPDRTREQAAWELLYAIGELYPERLEALNAIRKRLVSDYIDELDEEAPENQEAIRTFEQAVDDWAKQNGVRSQVVIAAAQEFARGGTLSPRIYIDAHFTPNDELVWHDLDPGIEADPYNETRDEFLERAGEYYDRLAQQFIREGATTGPVKRDRDHFRYLVAHLVGGYTWAEIAHRDTPFRLTRRQQQSVAEGARSVAGILGIALPTKRGPRKGSRRHRRPV